MTSERWLLGLILLIIIYFWEGWVRLLSGIIRSFNSKHNQIDLPTAENITWEEVISSNNEINFPSFENINGEGIVSFGPSFEIKQGEVIVSFGPSFENKQGEGIESFGPFGFYSYLLVNGERIFEYGSPCGTCGIVFRKVRSPKNQISDPEAVQLLGDLNEVPSDQTLQRLARVLEPGTYHPIVIEGTIQYIEPGSPNDYFATDVVQLFGLEPPENKPAGPWTPYYRFGTDGELIHPGSYYPEEHSYKSLVTAIVMPLHDPSKLNRERVEYWKQQHENGMTLTAFAVSVVDHQRSMSTHFESDSNYQYGAQTLFSNCLLDGHHRIQAAAELGTKARILSLVSWKYSLIEEYLLPHVVRMYSRKA